MSDPRPRRWDHYVRDEAGTASDVDILVCFEGPADSRRYFGYALVGEQSVHFGQVAEHSFCGEQSLRWS